MKKKITKYSLRLYISGTTPHSQRALVNLNRFCEKHINSLYTLEVVDIYQTPERARQDQILAVPTLIKLSPGQSCRMIGDLSDEGKIAYALGLKPKMRPRTKRGGRSK